MLSGQRQNNDTHANTPKVSGFGKVLGSIQGLQQRLGDFSYADISLADANVKSLVKQLTAMRDNLANLAQLKLAIVKINQSIGNAPEENFDFVNLDSLEKHPTLHAVIQASKLIRLQSLIKAAHASPDAISFNSETSELGTVALAHTAAIAESGRHEAEPLIEAPEINEQNSLADTSAAIPAVDEIDDIQVIESETAQARLDETYPTDRFQPPTSAASFEIPSSETDRSSANSKEWIFDFNEAHAEAPDVAAFQGRFEFPANNISEPEITDEARRETAAAPLSPRADVEAMAGSQSRNLVQAPASNAEDGPQIKPNVDNPPAQLDLSTALVPTDFNFDQRLLDDVIKHYGDFAVTPNLPAVLGESQPSTAIVAQPEMAPSPEVEKPVQAGRTVSKAQNAGDLDRQLKKIIKDYGEYDLYPKQSGISLKTGGIAAFAVLGLVLAGLYIFKTPTPPNRSQTHSVEQPAAALPAPSVDAGKPDKNADIITPLPGTANASTGPSFDTKQKP